MSEDPIGDIPAEAAVSPVDREPQDPATVVHHGEALVAALLNTQKIVQDPVAGTQVPLDGGSVTPAAPVPAPPVGGRPPLTASTVISHTDPAVFTPTTAADVAGGEQPEPLLEANSSGTDETGSLADPLISDGDSGGGADGAETDPEDEDEDEASFARNILEWIVVLGAAVAVAIILRTFVFQAFYIPSESMEVTLFERDRILVNKVSYRLHDVNRGDVVVFRRPDDQPGEIRDLIKRVIALPGETVEGRGSTIYINGQLLVEPYLDGNSFGDFGPVTVPEGELFMMGDNRDQSLDSRRFGTIDEERIVGRAFFLFFPFDRIGNL